jgi:hypothetical protein
VTLTRVSDNQKSAYENRPTHQPPLTTLYHESIRENSEGLSLFVVVGRGDGGDGAKSSGENSENEPQRAE